MESFPQLATWMKEEMESLCCSLFRIYSTKGKITTWNPLAISMKSMRKKFLIKQGNVLYGDGDIFLVQSSFQMTFIFMIISIT